MALVEQGFNGGGSPLIMDPQGRAKPPTNGTNGVSRLAQMQARFQQKQLQEKEQKLLRLYENQQQRAFQRVGRGSAGSSSVSSTTSSTTSSSSLGNGKVRQLFDERRQTKSNSKTPGWDRSYPLEPLDNSRYRATRSHEKLSRGASLERINSQPIKKVVSRSRSQVRPGNLVNGGYLERNRQGDDYGDDDYNNYYQDEIDTSYYTRDRNANRYNNQEREIEHLFTKSRLYDEEPLRDGETFDDSQLFKKLTNVGGILLMKERTMNDDKYKTYNANNRRMPATESTRVAPQPLRRRDNDATQRAQPSVAAPQTRTVTKPTARKTESLNSPPPNGPVARRPLPQKESSGPPMRAVASTNNVKSSAPAAHVTASRSTSSKVEPSAPYKPATARPSPRAAVSSVPDNLSECNYCGRRFANDRVAMHQEICAKTGQKKRKPFDPVKQRVKGTEAEAYVKNASKQKEPAKAATPKKSDWRRKHEEFISAIRAAKEVKAHLAAGGKLSDLPPPPPSENLDYVQCQHCNRRFNQAAAERHIPRCADMQHNKPKPKAPPARGGGAISKKR